MHSPVLVGHDPDLDFLDYDCDWDDSADDFYEEATNAPKEKRRRVSGIESPRPRKKQRGLTSKNPASLCEPVIWIPLSQSLHPLELPKQQHNGAEVVALLEDWREHLTGSTAMARLSLESSLSYVPPQSTNRPGGSGAKRKRGIETTDGKAIAESAKSPSSPKKKARKQVTAALERSRVDVREKATDSQQEPAVSLRKPQHQPGQVLREVRLPPAALTDGQGNANRRGRPPSKRKAPSEDEDEELSKKKELVATKSHALTKLNRASGRQTRSKK